MGGFGPHLAIWAVPATAQSFPGFGIVMTYNVNEGTDFLQVQGATSLQQFLLGVGQILTQVQGTNPPERMQAVAKQILADQRGTPTALVLMAVGISAAAVGVMGLALWLR